LGFTIDEGHRNCRMPSGLPLGLRAIAPIAHRVVITPDPPGPGVVLRAQGRV
jgi:hypothetical protein